LIVSEPKGTAHATAVALVHDALRVAFGAGWAVRGEAPVALGEDSEPEPDVAVLPGDQRDYRDEHPSQAALLVEVSELSLVLDRWRKGSLYARAGVSDYWIVNLIDHVLEVCREPVPDVSAPFGWRYGTVQTFTRDAAVSPLAKPEASIRVAELLP
jgi:Uma2 family endonuclease